MQRKLCNECGAPADVSLCQIVSTVNRSPRLQRCTTSTAFCIACLQERIKLMHGLDLHGIHEPLGEAFTALANISEMPLSPQTQSPVSPSADGGR